MTKRERWEDLGCGDGACVFRTPTGMHTNGGCRCLPRRATDYDLTERSRLGRWISVMRDRIVGQERELERVQSYRAEAHAALAEAARAFQADDREALRLILCDREARSLAFRLRKEQEEKERELAEAERQHLEVIDEQERYSDALSAAHVALGGDGEWVVKVGGVYAAGETGDLAIDVPALAEGVMRELVKARRRVATQDAHIESMLRFICKAHDYLRGKGSPDLPAWVLAAMAQEILDCVPESKSHD